MLLSSDPLRRALSVVLALAMLTTGLMFIASMPLVAATDPVYHTDFNDLSGWTIDPGDATDPFYISGGKLIANLMIEGENLAYPISLSGEYNVSFGLSLEAYFDETTITCGAIGLISGASTRGFGPMPFSYATSRLFVNDHARNFQFGSNQHDLENYADGTSGSLSNSVQYTVYLCRYQDGSNWYEANSVVRDSDGVSVITHTNSLGTGTPATMTYFQVNTIYDSWPDMGPYVQYTLDWLTIYDVAEPASSNPTWAPYFHSLPEEDWIVNTYYTYEPQTNESATITAPVLPAWATYSGGLIYGTPTSTGDYDFSLKAVSTAGTLAAYQNFTVHVGLGAPNAVFTWTVGGSAPNTVSFTPQVFGASEGWSYAWDFGDGGTSTGMAPDHWYTHPGTFTVTLNVSYGAAYDVEINEVEVDPNQLTTSPPTTAVVGMPYSYVPTSESGTPAYYLSTDAPFLEISNGVISGTPSVVGQYQVSVRAEFTTQYSIWQNYTLTVTEVISSAPRTAGYVGVQYSYQVTAAVDVTGWSMTGPAWLSISAGGLITGTPPATGSHAISVTAQTAEGDEVQNYTLTVTQAITSTPVTTVIDGQPYEYIVTSAAPVSSWGLSGSTTWLMPGPFDPYEQRVHGTSPIGHAGPYTVNVRATINGVDLWQNYTLTVSPDVTMAFSSTPVLNATANVTYQYQVTSPYNVVGWSIDGPEWLSISSTGLITGTPPNITQGRFAVVVTAELAGGAVASQEYTLRVARQPLTLDDMMVTLVGVLAFGMVLTLLVGVMTKRRAY